MKYSKVKMNTMKNEEANTESALAALERQLEQGVNNKDALEEQIRCKTQGAIIRSKARWYNKGEKEK